MSNLNFVIALPHATKNTMMRNTSLAGIHHPSSFSFPFLFLFVIKLNSISTIVFPPRFHSTSKALSAMSTSHKSILSVGMWSTFWCASIPSFMIDSILIHHQFIIFCFVRKFFFLYFFFFCNSRRDKSENELLVHPQLLVLSLSYRLFFYGFLITHNFSQKRTSR